MLAAAVAGLTVAHFAMRAPLEAQIQETPKVLKAGTVMCSSLMIMKNPEENPDGNVLNGYFGLGSSGVMLMLSTDKGQIEMSSGIGQEIELKIEQDREQLLLSADQLIFKREEQSAARLKKQVRELLNQRVERIKKGKGVEDIDKQVEELNGEYNKSVHEVVRLGMSKTGGGWLSVNNPLGTPVVNAYSNPKNSGQITIHDANGVGLDALPLP